MPGLSLLEPLGVPVYSAVCDIIQGVARHHLGDSAGGRDSIARARERVGAHGRWLLYGAAMAEAEYERILEAVDKQLTLTPYLLGDAPCAVDAVILGGLRGHTMVDPVPSRLVDNYPRVRDWAEIGTGKADSWDGSGSQDSNTGFTKFMLNSAPHLSHGG